MAHLMQLAHSASANRRRGAGKKEKKNAYGKYRVRIAELLGFITDVEGQKDRWDLPRCPKNIFIPARSSSFLGIFRHKVAKVRPRSEHGVPALAKLHLARAGNMTETNADFAQDRSRRGRWLLG